MRGEHNSSISVSSLLQRIEWKRIMEVDKKNIPASDPSAKQKKMCFRFLIEETCRFFQLDNLVEMKHHRLARSQRAGQSEKDLKPNATTR